MPNFPTVANSYSVENKEVSSRVLTVIFYLEERAAAYHPTFRVEIHNRNSGFNEKSPPMNWRAYDRGTVDD